MAAFSVEVPHNLGKQAATDRLKSLMDHVRSQYEGQVSDMQQKWTDNQLDFSFRTLGFGISGTLTVEEKFVRVEGQLPFAIMAFRGTIENQLRTEMQKALV